MARPHGGDTFAAYVYRVITALVTPFRNGLVDEDALRRLVDEQITAGVDGLVPCGTTGDPQRSTTTSTCVS